MKIFRIILLSIVVLAASAGISAAVKDCDSFCSKFESRKEISACLEGCNWSNDNTADSDSTEKKQPPKTEKRQKTVMEAIQEDRLQEYDKFLKMLPVKKSDRVTTQQGAILTVRFNRYCGLDLFKTDVKPKEEWYNRKNKKNGDGIGVKQTSPPSATTKVSNVGENEITAYKVLLLVFNEFNENVINQEETRQKIWMKPGKSDEARWILKNDAGSKVYALVTQVMYHDGSICEIGKPIIPKSEKEHEE